MVTTLILVFNTKLTPSQLNQVWKVTRNYVDVVTLAVSWKDKA